MYICIFTYGVSSESFHFESLVVGLCDRLLIFFFFFAKHLQSRFHERQPLSALLYIIMAKIFWLCFLMYILCVEQICVFLEESHKFFYYLKLWLFYSLNPSFFGWDEIEWWGVGGSYWVALLFFPVFSSCWIPKSPIKCMYSFSQERRSKRGRNFDCKEVGIWGLMDVQIKSYM